MLTSGMKESHTKRFEFPDKDPKHWEAIVKALDVSECTLLNGQRESENGFGSTSKYHADDEEAINKSNARELVPWLHELQMAYYLERCDMILNRETDRSEDSTVFLEVLRFANHYDLYHLRNRLEMDISNMLERYLWGLPSSTDFGLATIEALIDVLSPFRILQQEVGGGGQAKRRCLDVKWESDTCKCLWGQMFLCITNPSDLSLLRHEETNRSTLALIVHRVLQHHHMTMKSQLSQWYESLDYLSGRGQYILFRVRRKNAWRDHYCKDDCVTMNEIYNAMRIMLRDDFDESHGRQQNIKNQKKIKFGRIIELAREVCEDEIDGLGHVVLPTMRLVYSENEVVVESPTLQECQYNDADFTVIVGSGNDRKEFECSSTILSLASPKLDKLVSSSTNRTLVLPHMNPNTWESFYQCIDPGINGHTICNDNALELYIWFQELEMKACFWYTTDMIDEHLCSMSDNLQKAINLLKFAIEKNLEAIKSMAEERIGEWFENSYDFCKTLDVGEVKALVSFCLPIQRDSAQSVYISNTCPRLWAAIRCNIEQDLITLESNTIGDCDLFPRLVYYFLHGIEESD